MSLIILLFVVGVLLLGAEVFIPGGVLGAAGGLLMLIGCALAFARTGPGGGMVAVGVSLALLGIMLFIELKVLPKTRIGKRAFLSQAITGVSAPDNGELEALTGKEAEALTTLAPTGYVRVDGKRHEAFCRSGHATQGTRLEVIGNENLRLIVTHKHHA